LHPRIAQRCRHRPPFPSSRHPQARIDETAAEIGTELLGALSSAEQAEARQLQPQVAALSEAAAAAAARAADVEAAAAALEQELESNLRQRARDLHDSLAAASSSVDAATLEARRRELEQVGGEGGGAWWG
jgi:signal transduction histidine kinase